MKPLLVTFENMNACDRFVLSLYICAVFGPHTHCFPYFESKGSVNAYTDTVPNLQRLQDALRTDNYWLREDCAEHMASPEIQDFMSSPLVSSQYASLDDAFRAVQAKVRSAVIVESFRM